MKKLPIIISGSLLLLVAACNDDRGERRGTGVAPAATPTATRHESAPGGASAGTVSADNSGRNERDRNTANPTSGDQSENEADRTITQQIRKAVMADDLLSTMAKNVKIITMSGVVTLRGPVESEGERIAIGSKAMNVAGVKRVDNQLEVAR